MFGKTVQKVFVGLFLLMLVIPLVTTNLRDGKVSTQENRVLTKKASLYTEDGTLNKNFTTDVEAWFNDNVGLRSTMVVANARIQYYVFHVLSNNSDMLLGPHDELNYATESILRDYQHTDLKSEEDLNCIADSFQTVSDYLEQKGIAYYYFQCWDKQSIYPEYFPETVIQYGEVSKTDQLMQTLQKKTSVKVISPKQALTDAKSTCPTYSVWGDATHWTQRGAYIGYRLLMETINSDAEGKYKVLQEQDYDITIKDQGSTLFGGIHREEWLEDFAVRSPKAYLSEEAPVCLSQWANRTRKVYYNDAVDNEDTLLILGDSYFDNFLYDDLAESFHRVVLVWGDYTENIEELVNYYRPAIVVSENAERCDRTSCVVKAAEKLRANGH